MASRARTSRRTCCPAYTSKAAGERSLRTESWSPLTRRWQPKSPSHSRPLAKRGEQLVDLERLHRLQLRAAAGAEGNRDARDRRRVWRLDDVDEVEGAERRPLVEDLRTELLDVLVHRLEA